MIVHLLACGQPVCGTLLAAEPKPQEHFTVPVDDSARVAGISVEVRCATCWKRWHAALDKAAKTINDHAASLRLTL